MSESLTGADFSPVEFYVFETKHVRQIADSWLVARHIERRTCGRVWQIVATVAGDWRQSPVLLNELQNGNVVVVSVVHLSAFGERRDGDERKTRAVAEEVNRLNVTGIVVPSTLVEGDEDRRAGSSQAGWGYPGS